MRHRRRDLLLVQALACSSASTVRHARRTAPVPLHPQGVHACRRGLGARARLRGGAARLEAALLQQALAHEVRRGGGREARSRCTLQRPAAQRQLQQRCCVPQVHELRARRARACPRARREPLRASGAGWRAPQALLWQNTSTAYANSAYCHMLSSASWPCALLLKASSTVPADRSGARLRTSCVTPPALGTRLHQSPAGPAPRRAPGGPPAGMGTRLARPLPAAPPPPPRRPQAPIGEGQHLLKHSTDSVASRAKHSRSAEAQAPRARPPCTA